MLHANAALSRNGRRKMASRPYRLRGQIIRVRRCCFEFSERWRAPSGVLKRGG